MVQGNPQRLARFADKRDSALAWIELNVVVGASLAVTPHRTATSQGGQCMEVIREYAITLGWIVCFLLLAIGARKSCTRWRLSISWRKRMLDALSHDGSRRVERLRQKT